MIACWKGIVEEIHFWGSLMPSAIIENLDLEKPSLRPSKWPWKLKPAKNSKLSKLAESYFEPVGKGGWPSISTWINPPSLGRNGLHCIEFPGEKEKRLLNMHLGELACLVGDVALLSLWKSIMNLLSLRLFNKSRYMKGRRVEGIFVLCSQPS
jgi:hypothetical protein